MIWFDEARLPLKMLSNLSIVRGYSQNYKKFQEEYNLGEILTKKVLTLILFTPKNCNFSWNSANLDNLFKKSANLENFPSKK